MRDNQIMETAFTALTTAPLVPLLERLYEEADAEPKRVVFSLPDRIRPLLNRYRDSQTAIS